MLNITLGVNIDEAAAAAIKAATAKLRTADNNALDADAGHGLPELEPIMGKHASSTSSRSGDSPAVDDIFDDVEIPDNDEGSRDGGNDCDDHDESDESDDSDDGLGKPD